MWVKVDAQYIRKLNYISIHFDEHIFEKVIEIHLLHGIILRKVSNYLDEMLHRMEMSR